MTSVARRSSTCPTARSRGFAVTSPTPRCARQATVGGNLCAPAGREAQRGDLGAPLIALGAQVRSTGARRRADRAGRGLPRRPTAARASCSSRVRPLERPLGRERLRRRHAHSYSSPPSPPARAGRRRPARRASPAPARTPSAAAPSRRRRDPRRCSRTSSRVDDASPRPRYRRDRCCRCSSVERSTRLERAMNLTVNGRRARDRERRRSRRSCTSCARSSRSRARRPAASRAAAAPAPSSSTASRAARA